MSNPETDNDFITEELVDNYKKESINFAFVLMRHLDRISLLTSKVKEGCNAQALYCAVNGLEALLTPYLPATYQADVDKLTDEGVKDRLKMWYEVQGSMESRFIRHAFAKLAILQSVMAKNSLLLEETTGL